TRLIKLIIKHRDFATCEQAAFSLQKMLFKRLGTNVIGPESPYIGRARNLFIKEILVKIDKASPYLGQIKQYVFACMQKVSGAKEFKSSIIFADVDPY
ncbi:MAG: primosomal protein N', partial [Bacteroidia bacterium]